MAKPKLRSATLDNGLRVLILEMHELPVVCTLLCYRVGARDEGRGETGLSHFLEHMMFKGTPKYAKGRIDALTSRLGGVNNAMTSEDATCYFFRVASDRWEQVLEIEADRMHGCTLAPREFEQERKVILEELRMGRDDPWNRLFQEVQAQAYQVHPYRHPIIGWREDVERVAREQMVAYYRSHYGPDRASLIVAGDVESGAALDRIEGHFGRLLPAGAERPVAAAEPVQQGMRRLQVEAAGEVARLAFAWHGVRLSDPREPLLDLAAGVLGGGRASRLYRRLVQGQELVSSVAVYNESRLDPGLFWVLADLKQGVDPARVEQVVWEEIERLRSAPPSKAELGRARARLETALCFGQEESYGAAMRIGEYEMGADLDALDRYPRTLARADAGSVCEAAREFLVRGRATVGLSVPMGGGAPLRGRRRRSRAEPARFCFRRGPGRFPPIRTAELDNGLKILAVRLRAAPVLSILCSVDAGPEFERRERAGLGGVVGACLAEGTARRSGEALAEAVESLGGYLATGSEGVSVRMHARDLERAAAFIAEVVRTPAFPKHAVERVKAITVNEIRADLENPRTAALLRFRELVYGRHPLALPGRGTPQGVAAIERSDLVRWHRRLFVPARSVVAVAGDVEPARAIAAIARVLGGWRGRDPGAPVLPALERLGGGREDYLPMDREQVHVYLGHLGVDRNHPDFYALLVLDHVLGTGSGFTDRISRKLRDEQGLAYSVSAGITSSAHKLPGYFAAYIGTSPANRAAALAGFLEEIRRIRERAPSRAEVQQVHDYLTGSFYLSLERSARVARFLVNLERFRLGLDYLERYPDLIRAQGREEVLAAARAHLHPEDLISVTAGPLTGRR